MSDINLEEYPPNTDAVLGAIWEERGEHEQGVTRRQIKNKSGYSYDSVRNTLSRLIEDGHLIADIVDEGRGSPTFYYRLTASTRETAAACAEAVNLVGEVPDEPTSEDFLRVCRELSRLRPTYVLDPYARLDDEIAEEMREKVEYHFERKIHDGEIDPNDLPVEPPRTVEESESLGSIVERLSKLEDKVASLDEDHEIIHKRVDRIRDKTNAISKTKSDSDKPIYICDKCNEQKPIKMEYHRGTRLCKECVSDMEIDMYGDECRNCGTEPEFMYYEEYGDIICRSCAIHIGYINSKN